MVIFFKGKVQHIIVEFSQTVTVEEVQVQFQGGFACRECLLENILENRQSDEVTRIYPDDVNVLQVSFSIQL